MKESTQPRHTQDVTEINFKDVLKFIQRYWLVLLVSVILCSGIGFGLSYLLPKEYTANAKLLPEFGSDSGAGGLSNLASLAGISLGTKSTDALRPELYPSILSSKPFLIKLLSAPFKLQDGSKITLVTYLNEKASALTPQQLEKADSLINLSEEQEKSMKNLEKRIIAETDKMNGIMMLQIEMPDPVLAASCTKYSLNYLTNFITEYRGGKKYEKVAFLKKQLKEAKNKYYKAEVALNAYRDRNRNIYNNMAQIKEQRLQNDYMQAQTLYGELAQQLEAARLQALEEAPVIKVLEPPMVANNKSKPKRSIYAIGAGFFGLVLTITIILISGRHKIQK